MQHASVEENRLKDGNDSAGGCADGPDWRQRLGTLNVRIRRVITGDRSDFPSAGSNITSANPQAGLTGEQRTCLAVSLHRMMRPLSD